MNREIMNALGAFSVPYVMPDGRKFYPRPRWVVVRREKPPEMTAGGIVIPDPEAHENVFQRGSVAMTGIVEATAGYGRRLGDCVNCGAMQRGCMLCLGVGYRAAPRIVEKGDRVWFRSTNAMKRGASKNEGAWLADDILILREEVLLAYEPLLPADLSHLYPKQQPRAQT